MLNKFIAWLKLFFTPENEFMPDEEWKAEHERINECIPPKELKNENEA